MKELITRRIDGNCSGMSRLGLLIFLLFLICGIYFGSQLINFAYSYYEIQGHISSMSERAGAKNDFLIRRFLMKEISDLDIPIADEDALKIERSGGEIEISLKYTEVLFLELGDEYSWDLHYFDLNPRAKFRYE